MESERIKNGANRAPHRSLLRAVGLNDEDFDKPFIGIANSYTTIVPGHVHLRDLVQHIKKGIIDAGGIPFEFNTIAVDDGIAMGHEGMKYSLPSREVIADSVEVMARAHAFDGLVLLSNCDKITPGMVMAAARLNLPSILITGGPMKAGKHKGNKIGLIHVFEAVGEYEKGKIRYKDLLEVERRACPGAGSCCGLFTANTMAILCEAMGISLPYSSTAPSQGWERERLAYNTGKQIMYLVNNSVNIRKFMTKESFENAIMVDMALGGSTNTILHLMAISKEAETKISLEDFDRLSHIIPHISPIYPGGEFMVEDFHKAGGVPALMKSIREKLHTNMPTVLGKTVGAILEKAKINNKDIIRSFDSPVHPTGGLIILKGTLAPEGAVMKVSALKTKDYTFEGTAKVYDSEEEAYEAIINNKVEKGNVVVIRYEGPKGGPGMREMLSPTSAVVGMGLDEDIALVTDGRFSGGSRGPAVGHICPEAASGGPIALVEEGDLIKISVANRIIDLLVGKGELEDRRRKWVYHGPKTKSKFLLRYSRSVKSANEGCVLE
ncbi:MAG: dihydroxy-acid dehydratase [Nitrososphaeria archaeon]